jgi:hypothetical protein
MSEQLIWNLLRGGLTARALALAVDLGLPERLEGGPRRIEDDVEYRILRALASDGVFDEVEPRVFRNNEASDLLRTSGWGAFAHLFGGHWLEAAAALDASGEASFPRVFGEEFWSWLRAHPEERMEFDRAMEQGWRGRLERLETVEWQGGETIVDVGGGNGSLLAALLDEHPEMHGVVFDLPETVRDETAFDERLTFVEGSFFETVPPGDVHLLSTILHDWDDESALRILRTVRASAGERLVLLEAIVAPGNEPSGAKWLDLLMLVISAGRERSEEEWRALLDAAGWEPTRFGAGVIEARPCP